MRALPALLLIAVISMLPLRVSGQSVNIDFDKKVIFTDSLNMPETTSALVVLQLLPELLSRPGEHLYSNYIVKIEDMQVEGVTNVALSQLRIMDLEKIEIVESPISSYQNNGVGGSINLVLQKHRSKTDRLWGAASAEVQYPLNFAPMLRLGHKSEKFAASGFLLGNIFSNQSKIESVTLGGDINGVNVVRDDVIDKRDNSQLARAYLEFMPTSKDAIKLNVSETHIFKHDDNSPTSMPERGIVEESKTTTLQVYSKYEHRLRRGSLNAEAEYRYKPEASMKDITDAQFLDRHSRVHQLFGKVVWNNMVLGESPKRFLSVSVGTNVNHMFAQNSVLNDIVALGSRLEQKENNSTYFVQPYITLVSAFGKLRAKFIAEYQHFGYSINRKENEHVIKSNDFTGKLMLEWHFAPMQNLRLIVDRKLSRPVENELYPEIMFSPENNMYVRGNENLVPAISHEVGVDYISNFRWGSHMLMIDANASYNHVSDIINCVNKSSLPIAGNLGTSLKYLTYDNNGTDDIVNVNLMTLYRYQDVTLALTGNVFHKNEQIGNVRDRYTYFNIALMPQFNLQNGWYGTAKLSYYSKVHTARLIKGDYATVSVSIGKRWNNLYVYVYNRVAMRKNASDTRYNDDGSVTVTDYEMAPNTIGIGTRFSF